MISPGTSTTTSPYYRARYYDPTIGRFLSEDPIRFWGGIDFYKYVDDNPATNNDPSGMLVNAPGKPPLPGSHGANLHGWWCGPNWTGGLNEEFNPKHLPTYYVPSDDIDNACMNHDICYYQCRQENKCNRQGRIKCMQQKCNATLKGELKDKVFDYGITKFMDAQDQLLKGSHEPGDSCGCK